MYVTYSLEVVVVLLEGRKRVCPREAHAGEVLQDGIIMFAVFGQGPARSTGACCGCLCFFAGFRRCGCGGRVTRRVESGEYCVPVMRFRSSRRLARTTSAGVSSKIRSAAAGSRGRIGRHTGKVKTALDTERRRFALGLASRGTAVKDVVEVVETRPRDGGKVVVSRSLLGILEALEVIVKIVKRRMVGRGGGCGCGRSCGSWSSRRCPSKYIVNLGRLGEKWASEVRGLGC